MFVSPLIGMAMVVVVATVATVVTVYVRTFVASTTAPRPIPVTVPTTGVPAVPGGTVIVTVLIAVLAAVFSPKVYVTAVAVGAWLVAVHVGAALSAAAAMIVFGLVVPVSTVAPADVFVVTVELYEPTVAVFFSPVTPIETAVPAGTDFTVVTEYVIVVVARVAVPAPSPLTVPAAAVPVVPVGNVIVTVLTVAVVAVTNVYVYVTAVAVLTTLETVKVGLASVLAPAGPPVTTGAMTATASVATAEARYRGHRGRRWRGLSGRLPFRPAPISTRASAGTRSCPSTYRPPGWPPTGRRS